MLLKIDLHVHSNYSQDGVDSPEKILEAATRRGLDGVALTDHDTLDGYRSIEGGGWGICVICGLELTTRGGHVIALNIDREIARGLEVQEALKRIRDLGGLAIFPHPYDFLRYGVGGRVARRFKPDALEVLNSQSFIPLARFLSERLADELNLPKVAGSDAHIAEAVGGAYTLIDSSSRRISDIMEAIRIGRTKVYGGGTSVKLRLKTTVNRLRKYC